MADYYEVLGVERDASREVIDRAIRDQLRLWQRRAASADLERRHLAERRVRQLSDARTILLDPEQRHRHDLALVPQPRQLPVDEEVDEEAAARRRRFGTLPAPVHPADWVEERGTDARLEPPEDQLGTTYVG